MPAQLGQLKAGQNGKGLLQIYLWCPDDLPRLWDRIEYNRIEYSKCLVKSVLLRLPGRVAQSVGHLTRKSGVWVRYPVWQHTFVSPSAFSRRAVVSYWRKYVHEVLVNRLGGLSLPGKSVVR